MNVRCKFKGELVGLCTTWLQMADTFCESFFLIYLCNTPHNNCSVLYNYIYCLHYSQSVDVMRDGSGNSSSTVAAIVVPLVVLLLLTGIAVILVAVLAYQLIKYKRQSME